MLFPLANHCLINSSMLCSKYSCVSIITYFCIIPVQWFLLHMLLTFSHKYPSCTAALCTQHQPKIMPGTVCINFQATKLLYQTELWYTTAILLSLHSTVVLDLQNSPLLCQFNLNLLPQDFGVVPIYMQHTCCSYLHVPILSKYQVLPLSVSRQEI